MVWDGVHRAVPQLACSEAIDLLPVSLVLAEQAAVTDAEHRIRVYTLYSL
jgi:hypothetical protein